MESIENLKTFLMTKICHHLLPGLPWGYTLLYVSMEHNFSTYPSLYPFAYEITTLYPSRKNKLISLNFRAAELHEN